MKIRVATIALGMSAMLAGVSPFGAESALTNEDVLRLTEAGLGTVVIIAKIESSPTDFDTSVDQLVALGKAGVDNAVIAAMVQAAKATGDKETARAVSDPAPTLRATGADATVHATATHAEDGTRARATPGSTFRDRLRSDGEGPMMVVVPAGRLCMGDTSGMLCPHDENRAVTISAPFALSVHEVTFADYDRFTYPNQVQDEGWGRGHRPAINVSWNDAQDYVAWLSAQTGERYRLPSEAEWEYAARAGTAKTLYHWGDGIGTNRANCDGCGSRWDNKQTSPAGSFASNAFGVHDMHGNVWEWVEDCWNNSHSGRPADGSAWTAGDCTRRVLRGGAWSSVPHNLTALVRTRVATGIRNDSFGFRVARALRP